MNRIGVNAKLIIYAPHIFKEFSERGIQKVAKKYKNYEEKYARELLNIFQKVEHRPITLTLIKKFLREKIPPIVSVNSSILRGKGYGRFVAHYVVIRGYKGGKFVLNDPHPKFGGVIKIESDMMIASIYSRKIPEMMVIE